MRVLVTGAGGFIGASVVEELVSSGHQVFALDRDHRSFRRVEHLARRLSLVEGDLSRREWLPRLFEETRPEAMIHLAWYANPRDYLTSNENLESVAMTMRVVEAAVAAECGKVVLSGTCVEYAPLGRALVESDPAAPKTLYAACKHATWLMANALAVAGGVELAWARIFHLHGPGEDPARLIPWVAAELRSGRTVDLTDGTQVRDHLHVADVASGLVALLAPGASGVFNVCSGEAVRLRDVLEIVGDIVGRRDLLRFGARPHRAEEVMFLAGTSARLRSLGWRPRFTLFEGLKDAVTKYGLENRSLQ
jgi:dTDP-6-deoxy-L-talose 4-dehydrogenase (NAD+)